MLGPYRILDLADRKALLTGKVLGCLGADVIKIERPGGDPARNIGPFYKDRVDPEKSLYWFYTNTSKRGITLDITKPDGQDLFKRLVETADAVVESYDPGYMAGLGLGYEDLCKIKPDIVMTSLSPFGQTGPYAHFKHSNLTTWSLGGQTCLSGEPDREPIGRYLHQADFHGGVQGALGTMMALTHRDLTGEGQYVDVSIQQAVVLTLMNNLEIWDMNKIVVNRSGRNQLKVRPPLPQLVERLVYPCKDGYILTLGFRGGHSGFIAVCEALRRWGLSEGYMLDIKDYDFRSYTTASIPQEMSDLLSRSLASFLATKTKQEIMERSVKESLQLVPANTVEDLWTSTQFLARGFWDQVVEHPELNDAFAYPGAPVDTSEVPWKVWRRAPLIGEHNEEIVGELGLSSEQTVTPQGHRSYLAPARDGGEKNVEPYRRKGILTGVKVIDFSWVGAGPQVSRELANHGALVVRIENHKTPDVLRVSGPFKDGIPGINRSAFGMCYSTSKYSVCLRLDKAKGRELAKRLIMWADVLVQSMATGAMAKWGFDYENVRKFKPDIIYFSTNQPGLTGPFRTFRGYGVHGAAYAGLESVVGYRDLYPDGVPNGYTDFISPWYGATFVLAALAYKRRTGKGMLLDQSQWEAGANFLGPAILDFIVNGRVATPLGNRDPYNCPQGVFRCTGEDRWIAIAVQDEQQWIAFRQVVGEAWAQEAKFATFLGRKQNEGELEGLIGQWTADRLAEEIMQMMQGAGVPAGLVATNQDLIEHDPQLKHREAFQWLEHQVIGPALHNTPAYRLSKTPHHLLKPGPIIGEDNGFVYKEILGLSDDEFGDLYAEEVIDTEYDAPALA